MSKITLDAETFKALASATRLMVLKALDERRKTLTELARDLELNKATVHEHLGLLLAAGLVRKRDDEGRKWIYYELTWTGQSILRPEATTTFNVLLGLSALAAGGGVFMLGRALDWWLSGTGGTSGALDGGAGGADRSLQAPSEEAADFGGSSASGTQSGSATGTETQAAGAPADQSLMFDQGAPDAAKDGGDPGFFDDGGWIALALVGAFLAFCALAWFLHWRLTPKPFDPDSAARAESESTT
ncbi:MAG: winged helix-turn-helix domain-containing protein [Candidatus Thermoplasmatota archaeon]